MTLRIGIGGQRSNVEQVIIQFAAYESEVEFVYLPSLGRQIPWWRIPDRLWHYMDDIDLYYGISFGQWPRYLFARIRKRATICHWVGTDVMRLPESSWWMRKLIVPRIDMHLAVSSTLADELMTMGVVVDTVPLISSLHHGPLPSMPQDFTVLAYLPEGRDELYGAEVVYALAQRHPEWNVWIVGRGPSDAGLALDNVVEHGNIADMGDLYPRVSVLIRPTQHDGLPRMILEALSWGRYVVSSNPFPFCLQGKTLAEVEEATVRISYQIEPNREGAEYARAEYDSGAVVAMLTEQFFQIAAAADHA